MKAIVKAIAISLIVLPFTLEVQAEEKSAEPPPPPQEMQPGMGMPMPGGMRPGMGMPEESVDMEHLKEQQEHLLLMHDLSTKILAEKDPKKKQALKEQQLEVMKAHILSMKERRHKMRMGRPPAPSGAAPALPPPPAN